MKSGRGIQMEESEALILAGQLELPVPHVYEAQPIANGGASISMDYVPGESLKTIWPTMTPEQKEDIAVQLRDILDKMRALPSETNSIQACGGGVVRDCRSKNHFYTCIKDQSFHRACLYMLTITSLLILLNSLLSTFHPTISPLYQLYLTLANSRLWQLHRRSVPR